MDRVAVLLLAAGASARMRGADKMLEPVDGVPVLRHQAIAARMVSDMVLVALPPDRPLRRAALDGLDVTPIVVPDAALGMSASIRSGVAALPAQVAGVAILPADMPEVTPDDIAATCAAFAERGAARIVRATAEDGTPGHPVVFPARLFPALQALLGDTGARPVLQTETVDHVALPARHAVTDLDTPEAWADWRASRG
jgi:CTP:molybdopterin cytidylyltransferase MocA